MIYEGHPHQIFGPSTYSQHGEDLMFMNLCKLLKIQNPTYLDLGAYHPIHISNTALLYKNGARGINVDANNQFMGEFGKERPNDINVWTGVGLQSGFADFYIESDESVLNSFVKDSFKQHNTNYQKIQIIPMMTISEIINKYSHGKFPDFLMTDLEDLDVPVLDSADFSKSIPKIICSEIRMHEDWKARRMMEQKGFTALCRIVSNVIFVKSDLYPLCI